MTATLTLRERLEAGESIDTTDLEAAPRHELYELENDETLPQSLRTAARNEYLARSRRDMWATMDEATAQAIAEERL